MLKVERGAAGSGTIQYIAFRQNGDPNDYILTTSPDPKSPGGCATVALDAGDATYVLVPTNASGLLEWITNDDTYTVDVTVMGYVGSNVAPTVVGTDPVGTVAPDAEVKFSTEDDTQVVQSSIDLTLTAPDLTTDDAIVNGVFQSGYGGTITANANNGYDVVLTTHPPFAVGSWSAEAYAEDGAGESAGDTWSWSVTADAPRVIHQSPAPDSVTTELEQIRFTIEDDWGIDMSSIEVRYVDARGTIVPIYDGASGQFASGFDGAVVAITGATPTMVEFRLTTFPDFESPMRIRFEVDVSSIVGVSS